ncbi:MAG: aldehyde ferredoxin oxidoreductase family protein [Candidatus Bathyarchaeia archaeon]
MVGGYAGKLLRVDLSGNRISEEKLDLSLARDLIGGLGIASKIMLEELNPSTEPFNPENKLILATGPLTGSTVPAANKSIIISRSPLTNIWGEAVFSANCGIELKRAGYDILIIEGEAEKPVYLWIYDGDAEIRDASGVWGVETFDACSAIQKDLGEKNVAVACIGPAGERLVRLASVVSDNGRVAGRCGLGAVMGSKRLKAIACKGTKKIEVANSELVKRLRDEVLENVRERLKGMTRYGTSGGLAAFEEMGNLPIKNWTKGTFPKASEITGIRMAETMLIGKKACFACPVACGRYVEIKEGPYAPLKSYGPEYETVAALGSLCMNDNLESIAKANDICNRAGIDTISTGATIAFAMECYEKGIITKDDTGGIELTWGNHEAIVRMVELIGKKEGFGAMLSEGSRRAAEKIGKGSEDFAMHVKGLELPLHSPYRFKEMGLQYAVSERGACHLRGYSFLPARGVLIPDLGFDKELDGFTVEDKGRVTKIMQDACRMIDALGICKFVVFFGRMPLTTLASFYTAVTGWETKLGDLMKAGERVWTLQRAFNVRMGIGRKDDTLPKRFLREPMPDGAAKGQVVELEPMLKEYYDVRGLDEDGKPKAEKLKELDLDFVIPLIK